MLELPRELRQLNEMRRERQEWAAGRYPVIEQGLLARFNPHPELSSQTSPAENDQSEAEPESFKPKTVKLPSPPQMDPLVNQQTTCPSSVSSVSPVDENASSDPPSQFQALTTGSDVIKEISASRPLSRDVDERSEEAQIDMMGRGRPFGKKQASVSVLPSIGRGFLLQFPPPEFPGQSTRNISASKRLGLAPTSTGETLTQKAIPQSGCYNSELSKDTGGPNPSLAHSFMPFRY